MILCSCLYYSILLVITIVALLYPVDTIKTQMQAFCADCPANAAKNNTSAQSQPNGMWHTMKQLTNENVIKTTSTEVSAAGFGRLWRGVQTMMIGCVRALLLYCNVFYIYSCLISVCNIIFRFLPMHSTFLVMKPSRPCFLNATMI